MKLKVTALFPDRIEPVRFSCGVIYRAIFDSIATTHSYFGIVEELSEVWWIDSKRGNFLMSQGIVSSLDILELGKPWKVIEQFEVEENVGAIQFLMKQSALTGKKYSEVEIIYG